MVSPRVEKLTAGKYVFIIGYGEKWKTSQLVLCTDRNLINKLNNE